MELSGVPLLDAIIIGVIQWIVVLPVLALVGLLAASAVSSGINETGVIGMAGTIIGTAMITHLALIVLLWLYFAIMESSKFQGTVGKIAIGLVVSDLEGNRISFAGATGRCFGKILSSMILMIGYILAGFTQKKQALHDMLDGTLVWRK